MTHRTFALIAAVLLACGFGGAGKRALSLENGDPRMDVDWDAANYGDYVKAWLGDHL